MGETFPFFDILIMALVAAFLIYRLRSVLGRRHGEERQRPNPFATPTPGAAQEGDVASMSQQRPAVEAGPYIPPGTLAEGLQQIKSADPSFDETTFLRGAREAFRMIVGAFAAGDSDALRPLLDDNVYNSFATAIRDRETDGETLETTIVKIVDVDFKNARMDGAFAHVTVEFTSDQINVTRNPEGDVVDGNPDRAEQVVDIWTFVRNTRSNDPNWLLVETNVMG